MTPSVLDASALLLALTGKSDSAAALRARLTQGGHHAPHLIDAEVGNVLRRHVRQGLLSPDEGRRALHTSAVLIDYRYPHTGPIGELAWRWRANLTFYDALYVALATLLDIPLWTADVRLSKAPNLSCAVELV